MGTSVVSNETVPAGSLPSTADGDSVTLTNASVSGGAYSPGSGADSVTITNSTIAGGFLGGSGDDTFAGTSSTISNNVSLQDGDDHLTLDAVTMSGSGGNNRVISGGDGDDQLSMNAMTGLFRADLGGGNDSLTLSNSTLVDSGGGISAGAGSDSVSLQGATVPFNQTINLGHSTTGDFDTLVMTDSSMTSGGVSSSGDGNFAVTIDNSTVHGFANTDSSLYSAVSLGNTGGGSVLITNSSSVTGAVNTGNGGDTVHIDGGSTVTGFVQTHGGADVINISGGASVGIIDPGEGSDSIHIKDATVDLEIRDIVISTLAGSDTILIEDTTFNSGGYGVWLSGSDNHLTIRNSDMHGDDLAFGSGNSTISITETTLRAINDQPGGHQVSLAITDSTVHHGVEFKESPTQSQTINIRHSDIGLAGGHGQDYGLLTQNGDDRISVTDNSTLAVNYSDFHGGNDLFVLGTDTSLIAPDQRFDYILGGTGTDTLKLYGNEPFKLTLEGSLKATLSDGITTVSVITNENIGMIQSFPSHIAGTLSLSSTDTTVKLREFEALEAVRCFVNGTLITTARGDMSVEQLRAGDLVQTADAGLQPIRWAGTSEVTALNQLLHPRLTPIRIKQGAWGNGLPLRDLLVSPQHRMLVSGKLVERMFGVKEALVAAKHLLGIDGIERATGMGGFAYTHLLFDAHQIVYAEGTPSESLFAGEMAMRTMDDDTRKELELIFPDLGLPVSDFIMLPARHFVNGRQGRKFAERAIKNGFALLEKNQSMVHSLVSLQSQKNEANILTSHCEASRNHHDTAYYTV